MELRHRHVGGGIVWREAILGHEQPGCELARQPHEETYIYRPNAHAGSSMSKFRVSWEFQLSRCGFDFQRDMLDLGLLCCLYLLTADAGAAVCLCSSFYHLIYSPSLPTSYKSILQSSLQTYSQTYTQRHTQDFFFLRALLPVGYLHCTDIVTSAVSLQERKKKSLGSFSLNKVPKQCVHLHFILCGIAALYSASKRKL